MALEGTLNTPLGNVPKKTAVIAAGGLALVVAVVWYRSKKTAASAVSTEINPATGFPYGSPDDLAALAAQNAIPLPIGGGGGGGGGQGATDGSGPGPGQFTSNAQWTQAVVEYMVSHNLVVDSGPLSAALGRYITGQPAGDDQNRTLIQQAVAIEGYPPVAGPGGYPPSINTTASNPGPGNQSPPPETPPPLGTPVLSVSQRKNWIELRCTAVAGATGYRFYQTHLQRFGDQPNPAFDWWVGNGGASYQFAVAAIRNGEVGPPSAWVTVVYDPK